MPQIKPAHNSAHLLPLMVRMHDAAMLVVSVRRNGTDKNTSPKDPHVLFGSHRLPSQFFQNLFEASRLLSGSEWLVLLGAFLAPVIAG